MSQIAVIRSADLGGSSAAVAAARPGDQARRTHADWQQAELRQGGWRCRECQRGDEHQPSALPRRQFVLNDRPPSGLRTRFDQSPTFVVLSSTPQSGRRTPYSATHNGSCDRRPAPVDGRYVEFRPGRTPVLGRLSERIVRRVGGGGCDGGFAQLLALRLCRGLL